MKLSNTQISAYFDKIKLSKESQALPPCYQQLKDITVAHLIAFGFENLDMHNELNNPNEIPQNLSIAHLFNKFVEQGRGGLCFEHCEVLRHVLLNLGYELKSYLAKVMWMRDDKSQPYHQLLVVKIDNIDYLIEPGFGAPGPIEPLILRVDDKVYLKEQQFDHHGTNRFRIVLDSDNEMQLQSVTNTQWHPDDEFKPLYAFTTKNTLTAKAHQQSNYDVTVSKDSPFAKRIFITQPYFDNEKIARKSLTDKFFKITDSKGEISFSISSESEFLKILSSEFKVTLAPQTKLSAKSVTFSHLSQNPAPQKQESNNADALTVLFFSENAKKVSQSEETSLKVMPSAAKVSKSKCDRELKALEKDTMSFFSKEDTKRTKAALK